jgi:hypothetical protein
MATCAHVRHDLRNLLRSILLATGNPGLERFALSEAEALCRFHTPALTAALKDNEARRQSKRPRPNPKSQLPWEGPAA